MTKAHPLSALARCFAVGSMLVAAAAASHAREVVDDAGRRVELPERVSRVFAAGAPAEILLYTLVPEMLVGRNHQPSEAALALMPPQYRSLPTITTLPERDDAAYDAELVNLKPDVYVDYGTVDEDYVAALEAITARTGVPGIILDGRLENVPAVYRRLGAALGVPERGERLASVVERILTKYRGALAARPPRVYLACSPNGASPCFEDQAVAWLGAVNVAGTPTMPRRPWSTADVAVAEPDVVVAGDAARLAADAAWRAVPAVVAGRLHSPPAVPFNWGARPPSVNRLLGLVWLAYVLPGRELDAEFFADTAALFDALYHVSPTAQQLRELVAR